MDIIQFVMTRPISVILLSIAVGIVSVQTINSVIELLKYKRTDAMKKLITSIMLIATGIIITGLYRTEQLPYVTYEPIVKVGQGVGATYR